LCYVLFSGLIEKIFWSEPLEKKQQDEANLENIRNTIDTLNEKIVSIMDNGPKDSIEIPIKGTWTIDSSDNSISFKTNTKISNFAVDTDNWIELSRGEKTVISGKADSSGNSIIYQNKIKLNEPWGISSQGKMSSSNVKRIDIDKKGTTIKITLVE